MMATINSSGGVCDGQRTLSVVSYNMHGFNSGSPAVADLLSSHSPDILLFQEHWLTPDKLASFDIQYPQYLCFGSSAMSDAVQQGPLRGRPYGGVMTLINRTFSRVTRVICATDRYVVVVVGMMLIINVYLPCSGSDDRVDLCEEILYNLSLVLSEYPQHQVIVGGDLNVDLDRYSSVSVLVNDFLDINKLYRCDLLNYDVQLSTYYNESLGHASNIDYILVSDIDNVLGYSVLDPDVNLSDHRPIITRYCCSAFNDCVTGKGSDSSNCRPTHCIPQMRWDHANLDLYRNITDVLLRPLFDEVRLFDLCTNVSAYMINDVYDKLVNILLQASDVAVPRCRKNFFRYWWDDRMKEIKERSVASCRMWKEAGRPRSGPIFDIYRKDKSVYKRELRARKRDEREIYTNELHEALLKKQGRTFWNCWSSKFGSSGSRITCVNGIADDNAIADKFAQHFAKVCTNNSASGFDRLAHDYSIMRSGYVGHLFNDSCLFDAELVQNMINKMKRGKAGGLDGITIEHLQFSHDLLPCILAKLFNIMLINGHVPRCFGESFTVPVLKSNSSVYCKTLTVDDFRGIAISPVISKVFEHCILERFADYFVTSDNQFGFKRHSGCSYALYTLRSVVDYYVKYGSTVNICSIDLSKAFDKMDHHALFIQLMRRNIPVILLKLLETWFDLGVTCVKWGSYFSEHVKLSCGIRQGGVLSPYLFAVFIDSVVGKIKASGLGCYIKHVCFSVLLYADDIILVAPSVSALETLLSVCETELRWMDMVINTKKSSCLRVGPRHKINCNNITNINKVKLEWCNEIRYLGVYITSSSVYSCSFRHSKQAVYRSFNAIFGKVGRIASDEVVLELFKKKCLPVLLYGTEACPLKKSHIASLQFVVNSCFAKIFNIRSKTVIEECQFYFNFSAVSDQIAKRAQKFLVKYENSGNILCTAVRPT